MKTIKQLIFALADIKKMIKENYKHMGDKEIEETYNLELNLMSKIMKNKK